MKVIIHLMKGLRPYTSAAVIAAIPTQADPDLPLPLTILTKTKMTIRRYRKLTRQTSYNAQPR
jgi:hypothetical protein